MEQIEAILGFEWNSMSGICSGEAEFMAQLLSNPPISNEVPRDSSFPTFWQDCLSNDSIDQERSMRHSPGETNVSIHHSFLQGGGIFFPFSSSNEGYYHDMSRHDFANVDNNYLMGVDFCKESSDFLNLDVSNDSVESDEIVSECVFPGNDLNFGEDFVVSNMPELPRGDSTGSPSESKKRSRPSAEVQRNQRKRKLKKTMNNDDDDDSNDKDKNNKTKICSSSHFSLDGSNGSGAHNSNGKTRACRGSATDPQSLYARKRRERINERLRILQNLVPNGTKVDISTMLEEAVQYVKFLQLQIKLLSSDEMWMYAPIAYNGMDIGLDLKISIKP